MYAIRDLIKNDHNHPFEELPKVLEIEFEDGVCLNVRRMQFIYSNFFYEIHRHYPRLPIKSTHFITTVLKGKMLHKSAHGDLMTIIFRDLHEVYDVTLPDNREKLLWLAGQITDNIDNIFTQLAEAFVASIDAMDVVEIIFHPIVRGIIEETDKTETSLKRADERLGQFLMNHPDLDQNGVALAARTKSSNLRQILQCIGFRGYHTEVDGARLEEPTMGNYALGMRRPYDLLAGSLEASKSLYYADSQIQDTEYFGRRLQLLTMVVERIVYEDCGTQNYVDWLIQGETFDENGERVYAGDLPYMIGKNYLDETTGTLKALTGKETDLIGKYIRMRSPITCRTHNPHNVCHVCFGQLSLNVPKILNIGYFCAATMTQQATQNLLSNKHLASSSVGMKILLNELSQAFFLTNKGKNRFILKDHLREKTPLLTMTREQAAGLTDIRSIENRENINPMTISAVTNFTITLYEPDGSFTPFPVSVSQNNRHTVLTREFLDFLLEEDWDTDDRGNFVFNLMNWDYSLPILELPDAEFNSADHASQIAKLIESNIDNSGNRLPVPTLQDLFKFANSKLNVNMVCLEIIIYACMVPAKGRFEMGRNHPRPVLGAAEHLARNRSASIAYAYEKQREFIVNPMSFFQLNRPDSPMDAAICPKEIVEAHYPGVIQ